MGKTVLFEVEGPIALITLNRPERHNSICQDPLINLYNAIDEVARNSDIKVTIITGNGKSFCSVSILASSARIIFLIREATEKTCRISSLPAINPS